MQEHLEGIVSTVWTLLIACGPRKGQDNLAMAAMAFLTTVCRSTYHKLFGSGDTIKQVRAPLHVAADSEGQWFALL